MQEIFRQDQTTSDETNHTTTNLGRIISDPKSIKQQIDEWIALANDPSRYHVFYLDTEVAGFRTKHERLSTIQCLVVSRERMKEKSVLFSNDDQIVPYSLQVIMEEEEQIAKSKECNGSACLDHSTRHDEEKSLQEDTPNDMNINSSLIEDLKNVCIDDALPNGKIVILDVLDCEEIVDYFIDNIMYNENFEKVFHFKSFDLKYLGGVQYCKNVTCTHEISSKFLPYHLIPISNFKLETLTNYMIHRIQHYFSSINNHPSDTVTAQYSLELRNEIIRILTYSNKKELQESNWLTRPLTPLQTEYAAQDVIVLFALHRLLLYMLVKEDSAFHCLSFLKKLYKERSGVVSNDDEENDENTSENGGFLPQSILNSQLFDHAQHLPSIENEMKLMEHEYKLLESKMMTLQERVKEVMLRESITETSYFKLRNEMRAIFSLRCKQYFLVDQIFLEKSFEKKYATTHFIEMSTTEKPKRKPFQPRKKLPAEVSLETTFNLHRELVGKPIQRRAARAVRAIKAHARKLMNTSRVKLDPELNKYVWNQGIHNPPKKVRLVLRRMANPDNEDWDKVNKFQTIVGFKVVPTFKGLHTAVVQESETD
ncbi:hypothetical protein C9374_002211 [Naegleria lovaniensis]|uniref:3'-5' exonuclease domain-containing protein n=1 Tax=Naegleria lovaniensis TaxID=51637 RepID=A0AA88GPH1_NAELO|nr:uncharacterized protein C9374_002211 [Naegleria lovaniensis]KAG2386467.1 hypothetical protein C9374_002211 [Naegleria lovaniensis]